ncbi:GerAB/ArcD/ProY family transporter [Halobacillus naozhouensis]|uniref:GerAB/ArcD/ProY family transporter n=1 Tax=Halobacillus naozhouensis TaxID=554880 RepID=A0ABY8J3J3_9BACI|nr:GerAB/ArcD/ProY family transporter [Halobacillus naozhouensis]WFT75968.1 GerAB/ArcD/ProY family transporter [Halobacillus naozhouensis]
MSSQSKPMISRRQFFFIIVQTQIGVGILSMPHELHRIAKQDGWISLLITAFSLLIVLFFLWMLAKRHPASNFFQILERVFSKWPGKFITVAYIIYFTCVSVLILLLFGRMLSLWVLPSTPFWVLSFLMVAVCLYLTASGLKMIARLYTSLSLFLFILIVLMLFCFAELEFLYILPIAQSGWGNIIKGANEGLLSYFGFIVTLVIYTYVEGKPKDKFKTVFWAHCFVTCFYLFVVIVSYTFFSTKEIALVQEPVLYMLKSFQFPIIARIDLFFLSIWVVSVATSFGTYLFMTGVGLQSVFQKKSSVPITLAAISIFILSLFFGFESERVDMLGNVVVILGYAFGILIPIFTLCISALRFKAERERGRHEV